jgi:hypothetical protein
MRSISPLSPQILSLLAPPTESQANSNVTRGNAFPALPNEVAARIFRHAATPHGRRSSAQDVARFMRINRSSLAEMDHLLTHDLVLRRAWVEEQQTLCRNKLKKVLDDTSLTREHVGKQVNAVLTETLHVGIDLGIQFFPDDGGKMLENRRIALSALSQKKNIKSLYLSTGDRFPEYNPEGFALIVATLMHNPELADITLCLPHNQINANKILSLASVLHGKDFSKLALMDNPIADQGMHNLSECFSATKIGVLMLGECEIGDEGIKQLTRSLPEGLRRLSLGNNNITIEGLKDLVGVLASSKLEEIRLIENQFDRAEAEAFLADSKLTNSLGKPVSVAIAYGAWKAPQGA